MGKGLFCVGTQELAESRGRLVQVLTVLVASPKFAAIHRDKDKKETRIVAIGGFYENSWAPVAFA